MVSRDTISVQVVYASTTHQEVISIEIPADSTVEDAIEKSGILHKYSEVDISTCMVGIYGKVIQNGRILKDQDRVEIYRPLIMDPMEARRKRAEFQR